MSRTGPALYRPIFPHEPVDVTTSLFHCVLQPAPCPFNQQHDGIRDFGPPELCPSPWLVRTGYPARSASATGHETLRQIPCPCRPWRSQLMPLSTRQRVASDGTHFSTSPFGNLDIVLCRNYTARPTNQRHGRYHQHYDITEFSDGGFACSAEMEHRTAKSTSSST